MARRWLATLREFFTQEQRDADLDRELRAHLAAETDERIEDGVPPDEARFAARRALGNPTAIRERTRDAWTWRRVAGAWRQAGARHTTGHPLRAAQCPQAAVVHGGRRRWRSRSASARRRRSSA